MYIQKQLAENNPKALTAYIKAHSFGCLVISSEMGLEANHLPFELVELPDSQIILRTHVAIKNPAWEIAMGNPNALIIFTGPSCYVSPDLHPASKTHGKVAPSWNYSAVHVKGNMMVMRESTWILQHLNNLTEQNETPRATPWSIHDAPMDYIKKSAEYVIGIEITVDEIVGKYQASQQYKQPIREQIAEGLMAEPDPQSREVAKMILSRKSAHDD